jgi:hypothetical protein
MTEDEWHSCDDPEVMLDWLRDRRAERGRVLRLDDLRLTLADKGTVCHFIREVFCNPVRTLTVDPAWLTWGDGIVVRLARAAYDERRFDDLPILADALEDAGCADAELLGHLRGPGPHVRGCWAVTLLLGKE